MNKKVLHWVIAIALGTVLMVTAMFVVVEDANAQGPGGVCGGEFAGDCQIVSDMRPREINGNRMSIRKTWSRERGIHYKAVTRVTERPNGRQPAARTYRYVDRFPIGSHSVPLADGRYKVHHSNNGGVGVRWGY